MSKLDKLDWVYGETYNSYGVKLGIRSNTLLGLAKIQAAIPSWIGRCDSLIVDRMFSLILGESEGNKKLFSLLYMDHSLVSRSHQKEFVLDQLIDSLEISVAQLAKNRVFIHSGAVKWKDKSILIPGQSHSGKSNLVAELLQLGCEYYSDEYAVVDNQNRVEAIDRPLYLRSSDSNSQWSVCSSKLGATNVLKPGKTDLVVFSQYQSGKNWSPKTVSRGLATLKLMANAFSAQTDPTRTLHCMRRIAMDSTAIQSFRGEANVTAREIMDFAEKLN